MLPEPVTCSVAEPSGSVPPPGWRMLTPVPIVALTVTLSVDASCTWISCETVVPVMSDAVTRPSGLAVESCSLKLIEPL